MLLKFVLLGSPLNLVKMISNNMCPLATAITKTSRNFFIVSQFSLFIIPRLLSKTGSFWLDIRKVKQNTDKEGSYS